MKSALLLLLASAFLVATYSCNTVSTHTVLVRKDVPLSASVSRSFGNVFLFKIVDAIPALRDKILTGEYLVRQGATSFEFLFVLLSKERVRRKITFSEGVTVDEIIAQLMADSCLTGEILQKPKEGSLFPSTYYYFWGATRQSILNRMSDEMQKVLAAAQAQNQTSLKVNEILILASILEKEGADSRSLGLMSSVYHNRLASKMRLQSDPTVKYAIRQQGRRPNVSLLYKDLEVKSPYNTYRNAGLPPTPICCPGRAAINAAIRPQKTNFLYFVSDIKTKKTYFSENFKDHVKKKQQIAKSRRPAS